MVRTKREQNGQEADKHSFVHMFACTSNGPFVCVRMSVYLPGSMSHSLSLSCRWLNMKRSSMTDSIFILRSYEDDTKMTFCWRREGGREETEEAEERMLLRAEREEEEDAGKRDYYSWRRTKADICKKMRKPKEDWSWCFLRTENFVLPSSSLSLLSSLLPSFPSYIRSSFYLEATKTYPTCGGVLIIKATGRWAYERNEPTYSSRDNMTIVEEPSLICCRWFATTNTIPS